MGCGPEQLLDTLPAVSKHCTDLVCVPPPHCAEQPLQDPTDQLAHKFGLVHVSVVGGCSPSHVVTTKPLDL